MAAPQGIRASDNAPLSLGWLRIQERSERFARGCVAQDAEPHLECDEIVYAPTGVLNPDGSPQSQLSRRRNVGSTTFHDVQFRVKTPWDATVSLGVNNVFDKVGPVMYSMPSSGYSYYGGFDVGRYLYMRYTQKF